MILQNALPMSCWIHSALTYPHKASIRRSNLKNPDTHWSVRGDLETSAQKPPFILCRPFIFTHPISIPSRSNGMCSNCFWSEPCGVDSIQVHNESPAVNNIITMHFSKNRGYLCESTDIPNKHRFDVPFLSSLSRVTVPDLQCLLDQFTSQGGSDTSWWLLEGKMSIHTFKRPFVSDQRENKNLRHKHEGIHVPD